MNEADPIYPGGAFQGDDDADAVMGQIVVTGFVVKFESEDFNIEFPQHGLVVQQDETGERIYFSHPNFPGWRVYSLDPAILSSHHFSRPAIQQQLAEQQREQASAKHAVKVYKALAVIVLAFIGLWACTDAIVGVIVRSLPPEWEQKVGKEAFSEMQEVLDLSDDPALTNRVYLVAQRLKKGLPYDAPKFRFHVASLSMINAIALPGGDVVVMQGLLEDATPDELAGVLAHEMAHVIEKHAMRQLAQEIGPSFVTQYIFGRDGALTAMVAGSSAIGQLHYSRKNERQADDDAFDILVNANIDPRSLANYFKKVHAIEKKEEMKSGKSGGDLFSTHPATEDRIKDLEARWSQCPKKTGFEPVNGGPDIPHTAKPFRFPF